MKNIVKIINGHHHLLLLEHRKYHIKYQKKIDIKLIGEIESYFQKEYGFKAILFPLHAGMHQF